MKALKKNNKFKIYNLKFTILIILILGAFLRFYNLGWGLPYPFHPDERNMAGAITRLSLKDLNPRFYAYGQFPLYLAYFTGKIFFSIIERQNLNQLTFIQAILSLRFWSAVFSVVTIYVVYLIAKKLFPPKKLLADSCQLIAATAVAFTPGLIQAAHFGTTESILTFSFLTIAYFSLQILEKPNLKNYFWAAFFLGIALGSKISAFIFILPLFLANSIQFIKQKPLKQKIKVLFSFIFFLALSLFLTVLTSPYLILAFNESRGTLLYEISVAQGQSLPFYTRQFIETTPVIFQLKNIFPYALGWPIFIFGSLGFVLLSFNLINKLITRKKFLIFELSFYILHFTFCIYFLSQAFLFAKWTRFLTPVFPFFALFAGYFLYRLLSLLKNKNLFTLILNLMVMVLILPGLIFFGLYLRPDIRYVASEWIIKNIPSGSQILYDTGNVVDVPVLPPESPSNLKFPNYSLKHISFNFYDLDENPTLSPKLLNYLETSNYIIVPSRRIFVNHMRFPDRFPTITKYYQLLFSGELGFKEVAEFKRLNDEQAEETFSVFDHPVIRIYVKLKDYTYQDYEKLFR